MHEYDVIVMGAGPAGVTASHRLSTLGRRVVLVSRSCLAESSRLETIPALNVLTHAFPDLALDETCGLSSAESGISWWSGVERETPPMFIADRALLEQSLAERATTAGVRIVSAPLKEIKVKRERGDWIIEGAGLCISGKILIDATGRHSHFRRREYLVSWRQVAIIGEWGAAKNVPPLWTESFPDGWVWGIRGRDDRFMLFVFADAADLRAGSQIVWSKFLARSRLAKHFASWRRPTALTTREVTPVASGRSAHRNLIHIGDAALARDPIASQGLTAAISDGLCGSVAAHTLLRDPSKHEIVEAFFNKRQTRSRVQHLRLLHESYSSAPHSGVFWRRRTPSNFGERSKHVVSISPETSLMMSPHWFFTSGPVLVENEITLSETLQSSGDEEPVAWLNGYPIREYVGTTQKPRSARSLVREWVCRHLTDEQGALQILRWLTDRSILVSLPSINDVQIANQ